MKTLRVSIFLVAVLIVAAYLAGTLVAAEAPSHAGAGAPSAATVTQWIVIEGTQSLLLSSTEAAVYLPMLKH